MTGADAAPVRSSVVALADLSLEQLANIRVTSVSRGEEKLADAAAAITVVTERDIRRSGATTVPEALRMVPGLHVGRQNASTWAVSARGFSSANSAKLLVLSDSRSIYTPLFSGVLWDVQDYLMADIQRIEVIRGPGATQWGSNAVNGVINITTKSADQTQGPYAEVTAGTEERLIAAARYGGEIGDGIYYRVFGQHSERDDSFAPQALSSDEWQVSHAGFRADWTAGERDGFTVQGDIYEGSIGQLVPAVRVIGRPGPTRDLEVDVNGGNILARWTRQLADDGEIQLRTYYDRTERDDPSYHDELDVFDIDFQHSFQVGGRHNLTWGLNYRVADNRNRGNGIFALDPESSSDELIGLFAQDQIDLTGQLRLIIGTKFERNDFSGFEWQPSIRLAWDVARHHTAWAAVSKAARIPTRYERDISVGANVPGPGEPLIRLEGNSDFDSEELIAYEVGYRWQPAPNLSLDLAAFHNEYDELSAVELGTMYFDDRIGRAVLPVTSQNENEGHARGIEAAVAFSPRANWRLTAIYSFLDMAIDTGGLDLNREEFYEGSTPRHQFALASSLDWRGYEIDLQFRHVSDIEQIPEIVIGNGPSSYSEMDIRIARRLSKHVEIALVGRSLLHSRHVEFGAPSARGEIERSVYGKVVWTF